MSNTDEDDLEEEEEEDVPPLSPAKQIEPSEPEHVNDGSDEDEKENEPQQESVGVAPKSDNEDNDDKGFEVSPAKNKVGDEEEDEDGETAPETAESRHQTTTPSKQELKNGQSTTPSKQELKDGQSTTPSKQELKDGQSTTPSKQQSKTDQSGETPSKQELKKEKSCDLLDKLSKSKGEQDKKACEQGSCSYEHITLGEPEANKLQEIGEHLLEIGRQLLQEMSLVEAILGRSETDKNPTKSDSKGSNLSKQPNQSKSQQMIEGSKRNSKDGSLKRTSFHGKSILEEGNDDATSVDSITQTPKNNELALYDGESKAIVAADLKRKMSYMEMQIVDMKDKVDRCEGQIQDVYKNLRGMVNSLFEETSALRDQMNESNSQAAESSNSANEKVQNVEQQIVKMAQVIWELKCEIRAQMHFGKEEE